MPRYEAVLFDFDGVLLDSEPVHFACWKEVLAPHGVPMDWETYRRHCVGLSDYATLEFLGGRATPPIPADVLWPEYPRKNALFLRRMVSKPPLPPETRALIHQLTDYRLAIVSSSGRAEVEPILLATGLRDHFGAVVCGEDVREHKPAPEPYLLAAEKLGIRTALVVEDSDPGVASGQAAGFDVVQVDRADRTAELVRERLGL